jgi:hypothetical protein
MIEFFTYKYKVCHLKIFFNLLFFKELKLNHLRILPTRIVSEPGDYIGEF